MSPMWNPLQADPPIDPPKEVLTWRISDSDDVWSNVNGVES